MTKDTPLRGYTYPLPTEKIAAGAANIEELAEDVENSRALATNKYKAAEPFASYPVGHSQMYVSGSGIADGWPSNYGNVITIKTTGSNGWQWWYPYAANGPVRIRTYADSVGSWSDWFTVAGGGTPLAQAYGTLTVTPDPNETTTFAVTFPSGRFATAPRVWTQARTGSPGVETSPSSITEKGFNLNVLRATATSVAVYWQAVLGGE